MYISDTEKKLACLPVLKCSVCALLTSSSDLLVLNYEYICLFYVLLPFHQKLLLLDELTQNVSDHPYFKSCGEDTSEPIVCCTQTHTHTKLDA